MSRTQKITRLTWSKSILLVTLVFLVSAVATILLLSRSLYLVPPLTNLTLASYLILTFAPAVLALFLCARARPSGLRVSGLLLLVWIGVLFCIYFAVAGPVLFRYSAVECQPGERSGLSVQYVCRCQRQTTEGAAHGAQVDCTLDGFSFSPLLPLTERGEWRAIP